MDVKDILKQRRLEQGLTLDEVGRLVGVSGATISRWESGDIANMRRDKIVNLAKALDISPAVIMGWDEPEEEQLHTAAAHFDGTEYTPEQLERIKAFAAFIKSEDNK